jgi:hypothetical protein
MENPILNLENLVVESFETTEPDLIAADAPVESVAVCESDNCCSCP